MEAVDPPKDGMLDVTTTSEFAETGQNCKCDICGDIFAKPAQVTAHLARKHGAARNDWHRTSEPATRKAPNWKKRMEARAVNMALTGPFQCKYCDFPPTNSVRGVGAHIGHMHKDTLDGPCIEGRDFTALGTATGKRGPYKKRQLKSVGSQVRQALTSGKPTITLEIPLSDDITICVPLALGPPTFIERNSDG